MRLKVRKNGARVVALQVLHTVRILLLQLFQLLNWLLTSLSLLLGLCGLLEAARLADQEELRVHTVKMLRIGPDPAEGAKLVLNPRNFLVLTTFL